MTRNPMIIFVIIPVKRLDNAKSRLSPFLTNDERKQFCLKMLEDVLRTVKSTRHIHQTVVISSDPAVLQIAETFGVAHLKEGKTGLNEAVSEAIGWCVEKGATSVVVLPADIPLVTPTDLKRMLSLGEKASIVISSSRSGKGTNALLLTPPNVSPTFYGPNSFQNHIQEALKRKISLRKFRSSKIAFDIDTVEDLKEFVSANAKETSAYKLLNKIEISKKLGILDSK
jgi:2-phospho-L-lactate guanylyltransferase